MDLANALRSAYELFGCEVDFAGSYPGWTPNVNLEILDVLTAIYEKQNGEKAKVVACLRLIRMWNFRNQLSRYGYDFFWYRQFMALTVQRKRASIKSSQKFWNFVIEILENIPVKK